MTTFDLHHDDYQALPWVVTQREEIETPGMPDAVSTLAHFASLDDAKRFIDILRTATNHKATDGPNLRRQIQ
jgi:hypothetical protein